MLLRVIKIRLFSTEWDAVIDAESIYQKECWKPGKQEKNQSNCYFMGLLIINKRDAKMYR